MEKYEFIIRTLDEFSLNYENQYSREIPDMNLILKVIEQNYPTKQTIQMGSGDKPLVSEIKLSGSQQGVKTGILKSKKGLGRSYGY